MVLYASISYFFISCDGVILMGFCGIGKLLLILESLIYFVAWTIITSVFQLVYWVRRRSILNIWWYVIAVITMILFQFVYNTYFAPVVYKIREKASFNNSECIVKDGHNTHVNGTIRTESDCKGGNLNGALLTFDNDRLVIK